MRKRNSRRMRINKGEGKEYEGEQVDTKKGEEQENNDKTGGVRNT
jgi:hypothetical protein